MVPFSPPYDSLLRAVKGYSSQAISAYSKEFEIEIGS